MKPTPALEVPLAGKLQESFLDCLSSSDMHQGTGKSRKYTFKCSNLHEWPPANFRIASNIKHSEVFRRIQHASIPLMAAE